MDPPAGSSSRARQQSSFDQRLEALRSDDRLRSAESADFFLEISPQVRANNRPARASAYENCLAAPGAGIRSTALTLAQLVDMRFGSAPASASASARQVVVSAGSMQDQTLLSLRSGLLLGL
jgi:hypothetical protein